MNEDKQGHSYFHLLISKPIYSTYWGHYTQWSLIHILVDGDLFHKIASPSCTTAALLKGYIFDLSGWQLLGDVLFDKTRKSHGLMTSAVTFLL